MTLLVTNSDDTAIGKDLSAHPINKPSRFRSVSAISVIGTVTIALHDYPPSKASTTTVRSLASKGVGQQSKSPVVSSMTKYSESSVFSVGK